VKFSPENLFLGIEKLLLIERRWDLAQGFSFQRATGRFYPSNDQFVSQDKFMMNQIDLSALQEPEENTLWKC